MSEKEKAKSLVNNFHNELLVNDFFQSYYAAKKCAKIAVEEIINLCAQGLSETKYWQNVLKEIDLL